ncbi:MAG: lytic transglycosylase domain-containing protein [Bacteroidales bacterium]
MKKPTFYISGIILLLTIFILSVCAITGVRDRDKEYQGLFGRYMKVVVPEAPAKAAFAGEAVPLDQYYIREAFEREILANTFMHSTSIMMFKRAGRWFPVIEPILKKNGIPDDFKFLAVAESNLVNVVSPAGAEGYWQFIKPTGQKYGLEINDKVDERYNMEKATQAACDYFRDAYSRFNSWTLVAASYNRGLEGLRKALDNQNVNNYYDLYLNDETSRYIFRIMALREVYNHPVQYGFYLRERDFYPQIPVRLVSVDSAIASLPKFARSMSVTYRVLRELNPWIRNYSLPNASRKSYIFKIPEDGALSYDALLKKVPESETFFHDTLKINEIH